MKSEIWFRNSKVLFFIRIYFQPYDCSESEEATDFLRLNFWHWSYYWKIFTYIAEFRKCSHNRLLLCISQPLGSFLSFLEATIAFEGMGRPSRFRRFRKTHLENILPRGSRDRDPRYPKGVPWDQNFFLKNFLLKSYLGICRQVWGLLWVKSDF